jgi:predicted permease
MRRTYRRRGHYAYFWLAAGTLVLSVGVNLIVFTIVNALWLRPLPFPHADRLVTVIGAGTGFTGLDSSVTDIFEETAGQVVSTEYLSGLRPEIAFENVSRKIEVLGVTDAYFRVLGLQVRGRDFNHDDDSQGAEPAAIISARLWEHEFAGRTDIVGAVLPSRPISVRVIGVAPPGFEGVRRGERADAWIPTGVARKITAGGLPGSRTSLMVFGRLFPGQTPSDAEQRLRLLLPGPFRSELKVLPIKDVYGSPESPTVVVREADALAIVAGLGFIVLLGGCATLAALVLVHYEHRRLEFTLRSALGASRRQLVKELARELCSVAVVGTTGAIILSTLGLRVIPHLRLPGGVDLSRLSLSVDWRVFGFAVIISAVTLIIAAWWPIATFTSGRLAGVLVASHSATASRDSHRLRQVLLSVQVCAAIVVLIAASLFVQAVERGFGRAAGFDVSHTVFVTVQVESPLSRLGPEQLIAIESNTRRVREALQSIPGVDNVADGGCPIDPGLTARLIRPVRLESDGRRRDLPVGRMPGSANMLDALGVQILSGRSLRREDRSSKPAPAVITALLASTLWPNENPLGKVLSTSWGGGRLLIVGTIGEVTFGSLARPAAGVIGTLSDELEFGLQPQFVVHAAHPDQLQSPIREAVAKAVPAAPLVRVTTGHDVVTSDLGRQRLGAWFFSWFGLTALVLGVGGVFGLVAYLAEARRREFGVRLALGATPRRLVAHGIATALLPVVVGVAAGLGAAAIVSRLFASLLTGLSPVDLLTYGAVGLAMIGCTTLAALMAAWRLRRITPTEALRAPSQ